MMNFFILFFAPSLSVNFVTIHMKKTNKIYFMIELSVHALRDQWIHNQIKNRENESQAHKLNLSLQ